MEAYFLIESLGELYVDVQSMEIFPDSKFFVDCIPKYSVSEIVIKYEAEKRGNNFSLKSFVEANFILPAEQNSEYKSSEKNIQQHLLNFDSL